MSYRSEEEQQTRSIVEQCTQGLTQYAVELYQASGEPDQNKIDDARSLIGQMVVFWRLDEDSDLFLNRRYLEPFDRAMNDAAQGNILHKADMLQKSTTLFGLYQYANEMVLTHGKDALQDVELVQKTMLDISEHWNLAHDTVQGILDDLAESIDKMTPDQTQQQLL